MAQRLRRRSASGRRRGGWGGGGGGGGGPPLATAFCLLIRPVGGVFVGVSGAAGGVCVRASAFVCERVLRAWQGEPGETSADQQPHDERELWIHATPPLPNALA